jgi:hypothetical protein
MIVFRHRHPFGMHAFLTFYVASQQYRVPLTRRSKDTRRNTLGEPLEEGFAPCHSAEIFLFFGRELYSKRIRSSAAGPTRGTTQFEVDHSQVGRAKGCCTCVLLLW